MIFDFENSKFTNLRYLALFQFTKYSNCIDNGHSFFDKIKLIWNPQVRNSITQLILMTMPNHFLPHLNFEIFFLFSSGEVLLNKTTKPQMQIAGEGSKSKIRTFSCLRLYCEFVV